MNIPPWNPAEERYPAESFVRARAQLAATLTGAPLEALKDEIDLAEQQSAQWSGAVASPDGLVDRERILGDVTGSSYVKLHRFQNEDADCKPRTPLERFPMDRARQAGWHMRGNIAASPFVSLVEAPSKLVVSRDHWAKAIANNASALHTYTVPKSAVWTPDDVLSKIGSE
ncbi:hypothetical protein [Mesorhizobium ciceri]|uniref:hypothetical protein n=1 Tax=Mesorhizobium TaxID=68287 RepID=UPI0004AE2FD5|nr:hypothetical protein [Mesorhizobium ciceri]